MSTSISTLLQVTATQQQAKVGSTDDGAGSDFQNLLAEASTSARKSAEESRQVQDANSVDEKSQGAPQHEAETYSDDQQSQSAAKGLGNQSPAEDEQSENDDSLELSEAAAILIDLPSDEETVIFQATSTSPFQAEVLHVTAAEGSAEELEQQLQNAAPLLTADGDGETAADQQGNHQAVQTETAEILAESATEVAEEQTSQPTVVAEAAVATQVDGTNLQSGSEVANQNSESQPAHPSEADSVINSALTEQSDLASSVAVGEEQASERSGEDTDSSKQVASSLPDTLDSTTVLQQAIEQNAMPEVAATAGEATTSTESSTAQVESSGVKAPEAFSEARTEAASTPTTEAEPVPTADRYRFVQRVSRAFQSARSSDSEIQLKLSPPELGTLRISISVEQGAVSAKVETETAAARNILLDNLPALRERLAEQEIRVEKFDVDVGRDGEQPDQQSRFDNEDRQHERLPHQTGTSTSDGSAATEGTTEDTGSQQAQIVTTDSLDVSI